MRKVKLFFTMLMLVAFSVGNVWGATATITFANQTSGTSDGSAAYTTSNFVTNGIASSDAAFGTITCSATNKCYSGKVDMGLKAGASSSAGSFTISFSTPISNVTQITLYRAAYNSTKSATITVKNGTTTLANAVSTGTNASLNNMDITDLNIASLSGLTVETSKYCYIKSIIITYTSGGGSTPSISLDPSSLDLAATGNAQQSITLTASNFSGSVNNVECAFFSAATCEPEEAVSQPEWITDLTDNNSNQVSFNVADNNGSARNIWMKITASDGAKSAFAVLPISQAKYEGPASLPFSFTGGSADIETTQGMSQEGLGSDYTSGSPTTKLKFDGSGDYVVIYFNAAPGTLSFDIKGNGFSGGTFKVQESADGETYTDKYTYSADGNGVEVALSATARYVKFVYATKSSGNIGLGNIAISEYVTPPAVDVPTISGETPFLTSTTVTLTQAEADHIYYTIDGSTPTASSAEYTAPFEVNATATVKAIAVKGSDESDVAEKTFTKITPLTVAQALVEATGSGKYVTGTITSITEVNLSYHNATYVISDISAGIPQNEMIVYRGKYIDGADFTSADQIHVGDVVVVSGSIAVHAEKNQMAQGNQIETISAAAVAAPVFSPNGGGFMGETDVTITCETASNTIYYTLDGTTPSKSSNVYSEPIHLNATTTITAIAYVGEESSLVVAKEFSLTAPMTVAEALAALDSEDPINNVAVAGIISTAPTSNPSSGKLTYYISDDGTDTDELEVYLGYGLNGASFSAKTDLQVGDEVTVFGNLTIFNSTTKEFASGSRLLAFNRPQVDVEGISLTESTAEVEEGKTVTLHASVVPANATNKTIVWSVQSGSDKASVADGVVTGIAAGTAVIRATSDEDASIYAECTVTVTEPAPLSPWASVYTSNVTLSTEGGTSASAAKVKFYGEEGDGYDAIKAGTGSAQGAVVVNVPAGATALHFHAYGWTSESVGLTVTAPTGVTVSPATEISINSNSGIANNSPFTLAEGSDPKTDAYYAVSLSGNTEATNITISATSGKRFVLFGVNQEGGLVLESIAVSGTASVLKYNDGDHFDPTGLVVTGHYSDDSEATISEGIDWTFDPDPLTEGTTSVSVTATVGEITSAAFPVNGLTVNGAAPLSPWASVYTSNVTLSTEGGTSASAAKVKFYGEEGDGYDAIKAGTGSAQGAVVVNVPAGATALHFHAYGWNSESVGLTVTAPTGVTVSPATEISINSNSGIASNSPFTLAEGSDPKTDAYYAVSLSGNTEATNITISATSDKRFVLFGVNQEGGVLPILESIEIAGDLTTKSYKAGDALDLDGLTVNAIYSLGGTPQTPVDITDDAELEWSYAPLVENQTSITITATYKGQTDDITINDLVVTSADPVIYVQPSLTVNFGTVAKDASVGSKQITVTLQNVAAATATLGGTNPEAFSIDDTEIADGDVITISVASTATLGDYSATITITDNAGFAPEKVVNLSLSVEAIETPVSTESKWVAATAADLVDGAEVLITGVKSEVTYAMSEQANNNRTTAAGTLAEGVFTPGDNTMSFTLVEQASGKFALLTSNGKYLYAASSSSNQLKTRDDLGDDGKAVWSISIDGENKASIVANCETTNWRNTMRFNLNNPNPPVFACYASATQNDVILYVPKPAPAPEYETVRSGLEINRYYTVCLPKKVTAIKGASFWTLNNKSQDGATAYLEEETNNLPFAAGKPFIIQATAENLEVVYEGAATEDAGTNGALHGTLVYMDAAALAAAGTDIYMLFSNELRPVGENNHLDANRAYVKLSELNAVAEAPQSAPGRRVRAMPMQPQVATGFEAAEANEAPRKVLINGELFIIRGEKMYDAKGQLVK